MKIKDILAIVAVALTVGGCNQQDDGLRQDDRVPIKLRVSVQDAAIGQTRATTTYTTQNTEFLAGELVDAYIFKSDGTTPLATGTNPLGLKVTASFTDANSVLHEGDLEPVNSSEPKYYYPTDGSGVKIYAVHPSVTSAASFSVETDQTTDDKYAKSDLCYSPMGSYSAQTASQLLTFNHVLSKIVVIVKQPPGILEIEYADPVDADKAYRTDKRAQQKQELRRYSFFRCGIKHRLPI